MIATQPQHQSVTAYVRANMPYWAKRWTFAMAGAAALSLGMGIKGREYLLPALGAAAIVLGFTLAVVVACLFVAGFLHLHGFRPKPWMTKERGLGASIVAQLIALILICGLMWLYGMNP